MRKNLTVAAPITATVLLLLSAAICLLTKPSWLETVLLPFSPDGQLQTKTLWQVKAILDRLAPFLLFTAALTAVYAAAGMWLTQHHVDQSAQDTKPAAASPTEQRLFRLLLFVALAIRWPYLSRSLSFDELMTRIRFADPAMPPDIAVHPGFQNHVGNTVLAWTSLHIFGDTEWALRLPALLFGILSIAILWRWLRENLDQKTTWLVVLLFTFSPVHIIFSTTARGYSAAIFFAVLSAMLYQRCLYRPSRATRNLYVVTTLVALLFNFFCIFILAAQTIGLLTPLAKKTAPPPGAKTVWKSIGIITLPITLVLLPLSLRNADEFIHYSEHPATLTYPLEVLTDLLGTTAIPTVGVTVLLALGLIGLWRSRRPETAVLIGTLSICMLWTWVAPFGYMLTRYWAILIPFFLISTAAGAASWLNQTSRRPDRLPQAGVLIVGILLARSWLTEKPRIVHDYSVRYRELSATAQAQSTAQTAFFAVGGGAYLFQYYQRTPVQIIRSREEYQAFLRAHPRAACFADLGYAQSAETLEILHDVESRARKYQIDDVAVYFLTSNRFLLQTIFTTRPTTASFPRASRFTALG